MKLAPWIASLVLCSLAFAQAQTLYVGNSGAALPIQSPSGWFKLTMYLPKQGTGASTIDTNGETDLWTGGARPVAYAAVASVNTLANGGKIISSLHFSQFGGYSLPQASGFGELFREGRSWQLRGGSAACFPSTHPDASNCFWNLAEHGGSSQWIEYRSRRTSSSMTFVRTATATTLAAYEPWFVLEPTTNPLASSASSGGGDGWTEPRVLNHLDIIGDTYNLLAQIATGGGGNDPMSLGTINNSILDVKNELQPLGIISDNTGTMAGLLEGILLELVDPSQTTITKNQIKGQGAATDVAGLGSSHYKPGVESAAAGVGEFNNPFTGDPATIPESSSLTGQTITSGNLAFTIDMRKWGRDFLPPDVPPDILPGPQTWEVKLGPLEPFMVIIHWLMISLVTALAAERVFSEFRRL